MSEKILVVDDDEKICQILLLYLRSKGYEVFTCQSGSKAITSFEEFSPDLVLLDVMLPGHGRVGDTQTNPKDQQCTGDHAYRKGRHNRQSSGA